MSGSSDLEVKLLLRFNRRNKVALCIPLAICRTFATAPLKWLRFVGFAIYGQEGHLSTSDNGPELDYTAEIEAGSYYFISDGKLDYYTLETLHNIVDLFS